MPFSVSKQAEVQLGIFLGGLVGGLFVGWMIRGRQLRQSVQKFTPSLMEPTSRKPGKSAATMFTSGSTMRKASSPVDLLEWTDTSDGDTNDEEVHEKSHSKTRTRSKVARRDCKMVFLVRMDLEMGKGKMAAQCAHAALGAYEEAVQRRDVHLKSWKRSGQAKIALKVPDETTLLSLTQTARSVGLTTYVVRDAGRTQIAAGSVTVGAIGPGEVTAIDKITGHLKLL